MSSKIMFFGFQLILTAVGLMILALKSGTYWSGVEYFGFFLMGLGLTISSLGLVIK